MGLAEIRADIQLAREQIAAVETAEDLKAQLLNNVLPLMEGLVDGTRDEFTRRDEVLQAVIDDVDHLMDESDDVLQAETTAEILGVFEIGKLLANELETLVKKADEITKKRVTSLIKSFRQASIVMGEKLAEITIPIEVDDPDEQQPSSIPEAGGAVAANDEEGDDDDEDDLDDDEDGEDDDDDDADDDGDDDEGEDENKKAARGGGEG